MQIEKGDDEYELLDDYLFYAVENSEDFLPQCDFVEQKEMEPSRVPWFFCLMPHMPIDLAQSVVDKILLPLSVGHFSIGVAALRIQDGYIFYNYHLSR